MLTRAALAGLIHARDLLRETSHRPLSIREAAAGAAMSPFHFIRRFQTVFGETPHQFRVRTRVEQAKTLLALSDRSVTDVCMEVGFSSLGSFSRLFSRRVGESPSGYRRRLKGCPSHTGTAATGMRPGCLVLMGEAFAISEKRGSSCPAQTGR
jgi:AraC-like DNA-binding protein